MVKKVDARLRLTACSVEFARPCATTSLRSGLSKRQLAQLWKVTARMISPSGNCSEAIRYLLPTTLRSAVAVSQLQLTAAAQRARMTSRDFHTSRTGVSMMSMSLGVTTWLLLSPLDMITTATECSLMNMFSQLRAMPRQHRARLMNRPRLFRSLRCSSAAMSSEWRTGRRSVSIRGRVPW